MTCCDSAFEALRLVKVGLFKLNCIKLYLKSVCFKCKILIGRLNANDHEDRILIGASIDCIITISLYFCGKANYYANRDIPLGTQQTI